MVGGHTGAKRLSWSASQTMGGKVQEDGEGCLIENGVRVCARARVCLSNAWVRARALGVGGRRPLSVITAGFEPGCLSTAVSRKGATERVWFG